MFMYSPTIIFMNNIILIFFYGSVKVYFIIYSGEKENPEDSA